MQDPNSKGEKKRLETNFNDMVHIVPPPGGQYGNGNGGSVGVGQDILTYGQHGLGRPRPNQSRRPPIEQKLVEHV